WFLCAACALLRLVLGIFLLLSHRPRNSPLFPYTPLFRSLPDRHRADPGHGAPPAPPDGPRDVGIAGASARDPDRAAQASYFFTRTRAGRMRCPLNRYPFWKTSTTTSSSSGLSAGNIMSASIVSGLKNSPRGSIGSNPIDS